MDLNSPRNSCTPFLKWAGGKRWFVSRFQRIIPARFCRYIEPFLGSGALFFALEPSEAILSDLNSDLVETFSVVKKRWEMVVASLERYERLHSKDFYYQIRGSSPGSDVDRAARFIYLNRTCWNALYRVNLRGQFNVPIGTKQKVVLDTDDFNRISILLKNASLIASDFEPVVLMGRRGDLIFADPPYVTAHSQNGFLKYNEKLFGWNDQVRLMKALQNAMRNGAQVLATNADTPAIRKLYEGSFYVRSAARPSVIAADASKRRSRNELVITSWRWEANHENRGLS